MNKIIRQAILKFIELREFGAIVGVIFLTSFFSFFTGGRFLEKDIQASILIVVGQLGIMVVGQALLMISNEIDLSVGSTFGFIGVLYVLLVGMVGVELAFFLVMLMAAFIGFLNGLLVLKGKAPSLIITLGGLFIYRGLCYYITGGFVKTFPPEFRESFSVGLLGGYEIMGFNISIIWFILFVIIFSLVLHRTKFGNHIFAVGGDILTASSQGINPIRVKWTLFILCSLLSGVAGVFTVNEMIMVHTTLGTNMELESVASCVVGGIALTGGVGSIWGAAIGTILVSSIRSALLLMGAPPYWYVTFVGIVLICGLLINSLVRPLLLRIVGRA